MIRKLPVLLFALVLFVAPVEAAIHIWTGAVDNRFSVAENWSGGSPAGDPDARLSFPPAPRLIVLNDIADLRVRSIAFSASGYRISGNTVTFAEGSELFDSTPGPNYISCNVILTSELTVHTDGLTPGHGLALTGALSGSGGIRLLGGGLLLIGGSQPNTYTGVTRAMHGEIQLSKLAGVTAVPAELRVESTGVGSDHGRLSTVAAEQIADTAPVTVGTAGTLTVGATETIGPLTLQKHANLETRIPGNADLVGTLIFGGDITLVEHLFGVAYASGTFYLPSSRTITLKSAGDALNLFNLYGAPGAGLVVNAEEGPYGVGEVELQGSWNGPTVVNGGNVHVLNEQTAVTLQNGQFSGKVAALTASGGVVRGIFSMSDVRMNASTTVSLGVDAWYPVQIKLNGTLDLGSATLLVTRYNLPTRQFGKTYLVIENLGTLPILGTFAGLPEGAIINDRWRISYVGGSGNDITLTEAGHVPSTVALAVPSQISEGQPGTYTLTVTPSPALATPNGSATISKGDVLLATVLIVNGSGSTTMTLPKGKYEVTARYLGDTLVAPSEQTKTVTVSAAAPSISSIVPASAPGNSTTTFTIHGSNFGPGASVNFLNTLRPVTVISANELTCTLRTPASEGVVDIQVGYREPTEVYSSPFPITLTTPIPDPVTKLTFSQGTVSAPVVPGAATAWLARAKYVVSQVQTGSASGRVTDKDNDGRVSWRWSTANQAPTGGIFVATDLTSGEIMAGSPAVPVVPRSEPLPDDVFLRDPAGNFSHVILPVLRAALLQWSRPGVGSWVHFMTNGSPDDLDRTVNRIAVFRTSIMQPIAGSPAPPAGVMPGDSFVAIGEDADVWSGDSVDTHLGDTPGTATLAFPANARGYGDEGEPALTLLVLREHDSSGTVTVDYATSPANPRPGIHYRDQAGRVTFGPGEIIKTISIPLIDDDLYSGTTQSAITLSNPAGASLGSNASATITIADDEPRPTIALSSPGSSVAELDSGNQEVAITVTLSNAAAIPLTMRSWWRVGDTGVTNEGILVFAPGETAQTFTITYGSNTRPERDRVVTYGVTWAPPDSASSSAQRDFTIKDDDFSTVSIQDSAVREGETVYLRLSHSEYSPKPVIVNYEVLAASAQAGSDYVAASGQTSSSSSTLAIATLNDSVGEPTEFFKVVLSSPVNAVLGNSTAIVTIVDDDDVSRRRAARHNGK